MRILLGCWLLTLSVGALAQDHPCKDPEYLFIKSASKAELRAEYCSLVAHADSNDRSREITQEGIQNKKTLRLDTSGDRELELKELRAAASCRHAAGSVAIALERRFKSKPPSCS